MKKQEALVFCKSILSIQWNLKSRSMLSLCNYTFRTLCNFFFFEEGEGIPLGISTVLFHIALVLNMPCLVLQNLGSPLEMILLLADIWQYLETSFFFFFLLFRAAPEAYGSSQARGRIGAAAAGLHHSHSNTRSEPHLWLTPQLTAMRDP